MIISCHVPKTAGTSFGRLLATRFADRLYLDYGDRVGWVGPEAEAWRRGRGIPTKALSDTIAIIHGHFYLDKYRGLFPDAALVAFVREPVDRVISNYRYLSANPGLDHPLVAAFHRESPTLLEFAAQPWARDLQSKVLCGRRVADLAFVGIVEHYAASIARFDAMFGTALTSAETGTRSNASAGDPPVSDAIRATIASWNAADLRLYEQALAIHHARTGR